MSPNSIKPNNTPTQLPRPESPQLVHQANLSTTSGCPRGPSAIATAILSEPGWWNPRRCRSERPHEGKGQGLLGGKVERAPYLVSIMSAEDVRACIETLSLDTNSSGACCSCKVSIRCCSLLVIRITGHLYSSSTERLRAHQELRFCHRSCMRIKYLADSKVPELIPRRGLYQT